MKLSIFLRHHLRGIKRNEQGVSAVEFGLIFTPFFMFLVGIFDLGHMYYGNAVLVGAVNDAARSSTLERNNQDQTAVDDRVRQRILAVNPSAEVTFERRSYKHFSNANSPEKFTDSNRNGQCDAGEQFEDANGNTEWDADAGSAGQGGASDAVIYTVRVRFPRFFPLTAFIGGDKVQLMAAQTVLRNQPFAAQAQPLTGTCT